MSLKSILFKKLGYRKMDGKHQIIHHIDAQKKLINNKTTPLILDVGANIGQTAKMYRSKFPQATIYSFEPVPESFQKLKTKFQNDKLVKPYQLALSEHTGEVNFYINKQSESCSLLSSASEGTNWCPPGALETIKTVSVPSMTLDHFCSREGINHIDILKMDAQGGELMVLKGAHDLLLKGSIDVIYTEVLFVPLYDGQAYFHDLSLLLSRYGYLLFDIFDKRHAKNGNVKWADAIFIKHRDLL